MKRNKIWFSLVAVFVVLFLGMELCLRSIWGFCDAVLMQPDADFEYIAQPCQNRCRFGRHIVYNSYSQRNGEVDSTAIIILGLGDSVINGGTLTDQDSLATTLLGEELSYPSRRVQVLNISAGSWGPDNCMAYLKRYGTFNAQAAFLVCSSHDVHDTMDFTPVIDKDVSYPSHQYTFAVWELLDRYLYPRLCNLLHISGSSPAVDSVQIIRKPGKSFNPGFPALASYFRDNHIPFFVLLHAETGEQQQGHYGEEGMAILDFYTENQVPVLTDLGKLSLSDYRDNIHINERGQQKLMLLLGSSLFEILNNH
ncbi:hypothetical protein [Parabacteroides bouchesdurhonensis]|uniref:hypothetical protein n=1 Tax=Parabacteroides bouchesdurhonensis TaxID=1936995 RepID=UPI000C8271D6|nr:hypothetical protein [Parabacteroides bouchesdurhonensis]